MPDPEPPADFAALVRGLHEQTYTMTWAVAFLASMTSSDETEAWMILARELGAQPVPGVEDELGPIPVSVRP